VKTKLVGAAQKVCSHGTVFSRERNRNSKKWPGFRPL